jgi:hypothetical protein
MSLSDIFEKYLTNGFTEDVKQLVINNKMNINTRFSDNFNYIEETLLGKVSSYGDDTFVEFLLNDMKADPNIASSEVQHNQLLELPDIVKIFETLDYFDVSLPLNIHTYLKKLPSYSIRFINKKYLQYVLNLLRYCCSKNINIPPTMKPLTEKIYNSIYSNMTPIESAIVKNRYYQEPSISTIHLILKYGGKIGSFSTWITELLN